MLLLFLLFHERICYGFDCKYVCKENAENTEVSADLTNKKYLKLSNTNSSKALKVLVNRRLHLRLVWKTENRRFREKLIRPTFLQYGW